MKTTIGFTNKFYTLWKVSEPYKEKNEHGTITKQDCFFVQNLSFDLEKAKAKINGPFEIDLELRGSSFFSRELSFEKTDPKTLSTFAFGKYYDEEIQNCNDLNYLRWYFQETDHETAKKIILDAGYIFEDERIFSPEEHEEYIQNKKRKEYIESLDHGHHYCNGERIQLEIKQSGSFSFGGFYGVVNVITYETKEGKVVKYMGAAFPDVSADNFTTVNATISHDNYKGNEETKLKRIKILK